jgi:hypothetical protein
LARIELACAGAETCSGKLTLTGTTKGKGHKKRSKPVVIATGRFSIPAGAHATVELRLNAHGRAMLRADHRRLDAALTISKSLPAPAQTHSESVVLVQEKTRKAKK